MFDRKLVLFADLIGEVGVVFGERGSRRVMEISNPFTLYR